MEEKGKVTRINDELRDIELRNTALALTQESSNGWFILDDEDLAFIQQMRERQDRWFKESEEKQQVQVQGLTA